MELPKLLDGLKGLGQPLSLFALGGMVIYQIAAFERDIAHRLDALDRRMDRVEAALLDRFTAKDAEVLLGPIEIRLDRVERDLGRLDDDLRALRRGGGDDGR